MFLSHPFGAQKGAKGTAQTKCIAFGELRLRSLIIASKLAFCSLARTFTRSSAHEFSPGENIAFGELRLRSLIIASKLAFYSLARTLSRSSFACRQLSLDSRGRRKFGHAYSASENLHLFSAPLCGRCL
ncbi:MAG: hypothetical protein IKC70_02295 [Bacteroidaceae bacterium]|nr:hypothetical protein [Bacteroidaceae bacterium]